jgi:hypothetical protein
VQTLTIGTTSSPTSTVSIALIKVRSVSAINTVQRILLDFTPSQAHQSISNNSKLNLTDSRIGRSGLLSAQLLEHQPVDGTFIRLGGQNCTFLTSALKVLTNEIIAALEQRRMNIRITAQNLMKHNTPQQVKQP